MRKRVAGLLLCAALAPACAQSDAQLAGPALDRRVERVTAELRCLVCQNQTIADSHAELAVMLKRQVRDMLARGATEREAVDFMVQRYGDFVLYRPPVKATTWLLWFGPFGLLLGGLALLFARLRARQGEPDDDAFHEEFPA
jgi:cytochrome c-type biogenesis protein CcmH